MEKRGCWVHREPTALTRPNLTGVREQMEGDGREAGRPGRRQAAAE